MEKYSKDILTIEEQEKFINIFNIRYFNSLRNRTIVKLFIATGLRLSEMIDLEWEHLNLHTGEVKLISTRGAKDRIFTLGDDILKDLKIWKEEQTKKLGEMEFVFTTRDSKQIKSTDIRSMIYNYSEKAIGKKVSPHTLRRTFQANVVQNINNKINKE